MSDKKKDFYLDILPQPDDTTCGPTCLQALYRFYGDNISLPRVIEEVRSLEGGGTLAVFLACHALRRGYDAIIHTYNLHMFDPTWFEDTGKPIAHIAERLEEQEAIKPSRKMKIATQGYLDFLNLGGELRFQDLTRSLVRRYLNKSIPILTGLSSTYLYRAVREYGRFGEESDVKGEPAGHFVVLYGYDQSAKQVMVADPLLPNPVAKKQYYGVNIDRVLGAVLLGVLTHDANFVIIKPKKQLPAGMRQSKTAG